MTTFTVTDKLTSVFGNVNSNIKDKVAAVLNTFDVQERYTAANDDNYNKEVFNTKFLKRFKAVVALYDTESIDNYNIETIGRYRRNINNVLLAKKVDYNVNKILDRFVTSDSFDSIDYCIQDIVADTRTDSQLFKFYLTICNNNIKTDSLKSVA